MKRSLTTDDSGDIQFAPGMSTPVAFAVWDGANVERKRHEGYFNLVYGTTAKNYVLRQLAKFQVLYLNSGREPPDVVMGALPTIKGLLPARGEDESSPFSVFCKGFLFNLSHPFPG